MPPFSGFIGKLMLLFAVKDTAIAPLIWVVLLLAGLMTTLALAKTGSRLFWETLNDDAPAARVDILPNTRYSYLATFSLIACSLLLMVLAQPISAFTQRTAIQLHASEQYINALIPYHTHVPRGVRP